MSKCAIFKAENYSDELLFSVVKKHFEAHGIENEIPKNGKVVLKPNLLADKESVFSVTTNPRFVYAVIRYLKQIGVKDITVADSPGGSALLFTQMQDLYKKCEYDFLSEYAKLNVDFDSRDVTSPDGFKNKKFNIMSVIADADYIINIPKLKTHNITCMTASVKNLFGCIPGLQKPAFHAKYPNADDFSNMLIELAATVKPDFTIVDAIDIMEGNGPANGKRRHIGVTFSSKDVFILDKFIAQTVEIPLDTIKTINASDKKGFLNNTVEAIGDIDFKIDHPVVLPDPIGAKNSKNKLAGNIKLLRSKVNDTFFNIYPEMNDKCVLCRKCVMTCPKQALSIENKKVVLNKKVCIGCLCCDECCPKGAVNIRKKFSIRKQG
ncbi:MAG: DUF362 domain-containing protein [Acutalibacteraceae bacterium]|nr:DUF362 domain-containing protein [Acutalibacteraceae bacterium]